MLKVFCSNLIFLPIGTLFLEFWKRKQAVIQHKWDLTDFVKEEVWRLVVSNS